jgi:chemotaxis protein histidine kinase CheA
VDHGIESVDERIARQKDEVGAVRLVTRIDEEGAVIVEIGDDGRGLDWNAVRAVAAKRGLPSVGDPGCKLACARRARDS